MPVLLLVLVVFFIGVGLKFFHVSEPVLGFVMAVLVGVIVFLFGLRLIADLRVTLKDAGWASAIGHTYPALAAFLLGFLLPNYPAIVLVLAMGTAPVFQQAVFRILLKASGQTLTKGKSYLLAVVMLLADFFISSPLVALIVKAGK